MLLLMNYTSVDPKQFNKQIQIETSDRVKYKLEGSPWFFSAHFFFPTRIWWEPKGAKTTSEPKKAATPTNTKAARSKVALRTPTVNCLGKNLLQ